MRNQCTFYLSHVALFSYSIYSLFSLLFPILAHVHIRITKFRQGLGRIAVLPSQGPGAKWWKTIGQLNPL
jgi:hypothetical protein